MEQGKVGRIVRHLDGLLAPLGFTRIARTWNRRRDRLIDSVDIQKHAVLDSITMNAGVFDPDVHKIVWSEPLPAIAEVPSCTVNERVGMLIDGFDRWWSLEDQRTVDALSAALTEHVLPYLDRMHTRSAMLTTLDAYDMAKRKYPLPRIHAAVLKWLAGDSNGCRDDLRALRKAARGDWTKKVDELERTLFEDGHSAGSYP